MPHSITANCHPSINLTECRKQNPNTQLHLYMGKDHMSWAEHLTGMFFTLCRRDKETKCLSPVPMLQGRQLPFLGEFACSWLYGANMPLGGTGSKQLQVKNRVQVGAPMAVLIYKRVPITTRTPNQLRIG
ncbi:hypothetical protein PR048_018008 [Dryococelus australis]|uniref:Uncharacterized protein n=1 Tax=Dryococelus australis TaxID=614101 RepID=A0ABQ9HBF9_9NEOP|nr:hypothetical protein PR048_018008 [Dryococelus australis]